MHMCTCILYNCAMDHSFVTMPPPWNRGKAFQGHFYVESLVKVTVPSGSYQRMPISDGGIKKVSEYDQEISQSHTADQPMAPRGRTTEHLK